MTRSRIIGICLIVFGALLLMEHYEFLDVTFKNIIGILSIVMAIVIYLRRSTYSNRKLYDCVAILLLLGGIFLIVDSFHSIPNELLIALILLVFSVYFFNIHFRGSRPIWPAFPGGLLFIFAVMMIANAYHLLPEKQLWFVLFSGLSGIFWYFYFFRDESRNLSWAFYPAGLLLIFAFYLLSRIWDTALATALFPSSIILMGIGMMIKNWRRI